jgi:hypothetical protein
MFIKVVRPNVIKLHTDDGGALRATKHATYERTIECDDFSVEDQGDRIFVECKPNKGAFSVEKQPGFAVYVLNNQGDTIHTYRWDRGR